MGKSNGSVKIKTKISNAKEAPITSDDMKSLRNFMRKLEVEFKNQTSKIILPKIHNIIRKNKRKIYFDCRKIKEKLRICKKCDKWNNIKDIIQCSICEDNYHKTCLNQ
jgi:recombinational DNA repair protein RecR